MLPNYQNPFHVKELDRREFTQLLHANFKHVVMYGQRIVYGSVIFPDGGAAEVRCYQRQHSGLVATTGLPRPLYLIAIASDETVAERQGSIFEESLEASDFGRSVIGERDTARTHNDQAVAERGAGPRRARSGWHRTGKTPNPSGEPGTANLNA